jgi:outer membrane receptor protein involved in Fe transport
MKKLCGFAAALLLGVSAAAQAQGTQTGTLTGTVVDQDRLILPGVTVTVTSSALQGDRMTVTDGNGLYSIPGLPPGTYTISFELPGMQPVTRENTIVPLGGVASVDATMGLATLTEAVTVTAETPTVLVTPTAGANYTAQDLDKMAVGRTPARIAELAPGVTDNTPNVGQVTISGAFAYDNVFMVDGVDVNDNIFGSANNVFIEDAIEETQILTSGISAEYGRFSGGVINLITKRGGNSFSGAFRANLTNPAWNAESPLERSRGTEHVDTISKFFEGTLGGPIVRDRLWFFGAGRRERSDAQNALAQIGSPIVTATENDRYEIKLTGTVAANQTIQGSFIDNSTAINNRPSINITLSIDPKVLVNREEPNRLFVTNYHGVVASRMFVTAQYSQKDFGFRNAGGTSTAIRDSPFRTRGVLGVPSLLHYNAPFFSALDPEDRDNRQLAGSVSYFLTTRRTGSHDVKGGVEHFTSHRVGGNSQSATNYVFQSDYRTTAAGLPALDANGNVVPRFVPGVSRIQNWLPTLGAEMDVRTLSLYVQDKWAASQHLTLDIGVRFEDVRSEATGDIVGADTNNIVPRLAASYDVAGDGKTILQATYAHYSGKFSDVQFARNTSVGSPSLIVYQYTGPEGEGIDFAPGFDLANYPTIISGNFPTANVFFDDGLSSPLTKEFSLSAGREIGRGYGKAIYTWRQMSGFIDDFIDDPSPAGKVPVIYNGTNFGTFDRIVFRNTDVPERRYQALQFVGRYNASRRLFLNGHYTRQLVNDGTFEGEAANQPANPSDIHDYPEILVARNFPDGRLDDFQRHKIRLWAVYNQTLGRFGHVDLAPMWKYNSAQTYSLSASGVPLSAIQLARNPGYARLPGGGAQTLYFDERGSESFEGYGVIDFAATYQIPIWRALRPWMKVELFNVLNNDKLIKWTTTVNPDPNSPVDADGLPTGYVRVAAFGQPRTNADYPRPLPGIDGGRTFQMAFGLRF